MEYTNPQEVSSQYWIVDPLWVQLATMCARGGFYIHTHIACQTLGTLDKDAQQSNWFGCTEGDQLGCIL